MKELKGKDRRYLAKKAHSLSPVVMVGQRGLTAPLIMAVDKALADHELIKVKFQDYKDQKQDISLELQRQCQAQQIQLVGNILTLYREHKDPEKRQYF